MTEREKQLAEAYIPSPRDPELEWDEYYVKDTADRVHKVHIRDINPYRDETRYGVYTDNGKRINSWLDGGDFPMRYMYDNKQDCRDGTHDLLDHWEQLRKLQQEDAR